MLGEFLHARLVTEDAALSTFRRGVDGENCQATALLLQHVDAELVDARRLACAGHAADTHPHRVAAIGQTTVDDLLGLRLMVGVDTLDECDGLREDGNVALDDALDHLTNG